MNAEDSATPPLRLGLVGLRFGQFLARTLSTLPGARLVAVADRHAAEEDLAGIPLPESVSLHREAGEMIDSRGLDALVIATSPKRRAPLLQQCAERGLPVFVEKPWAGNPAQARELASLCEPIADRLMLGFSFRFHPVVRICHALLADTLGPAWMGNGEYAFNWNLGPEGWLWEADGGGGVFNENSCHLFDVVCHLFGRPSAVQATAFNPRSRPSPELGGVLLSFPSGAFVALTLGGLLASADQDFPRLDLVTAKGRASLQGRGHVWESLRWACRDDDAVHCVEMPPEGLGQTRYSEALAHFVDCLRTGKRPEASLSDGLLCVDIAEAVYRSATSGARVELPASPIP